MWYGLVEPDTGNLVSVGTEAMFPDGNMDAFAGQYDVVEFGVDRPDFSGKMWSSSLRAIIDRPPPVILSRLDDIDDLLLADPDFSTLWGNLNATRRNQLRIGLRRVIGRILGSHVSRYPDESMEL